MVLLKVYIVLAGLSVMAKSQLNFFPNLPLVNFKSWYSITQWFSTGRPREILLNVENSVFSEVVEVVVVIKCASVS